MEGKGEAVGCRWLETTFLTMGIPRGDKGLLAPLLRKYLLAEPFDHRLLIGKCGLVHVEKRADGGAMCLDGASLPVVGSDLLRDHPQLLGQMHDDNGGNVLLLSGKASLIL